MAVPVKCVSMWLVCKKPMYVISSNLMSALRRSCHLQQAKNNKSTPEGNILTAEESFIVSGRRVIEIQYFISQLQESNKHSPFRCTLSDMEMLSEKRNGLISGIKMKCRMCSYKTVVWTEGLQIPSMNTNTAAITGIMSIGGGFSNVEKFFSTLNIPSMSEKTFIKEQELSEAWEGTALKEMESAVSVERNLVVQWGDVDSDGIPLLTVIDDGSWAKCSYNTNFTSLLGMRLDYYVTSTAFSKCFTAEKSQNAEAAPSDEISAEAKTEEQSPKEKELLAENEKLLESVRTLDDKYKRALADNENVRTRMRREVTDAKQYGIQSFVKDLLEVADVLGKATESVPKDALQSNNHLKTLYEGLQMTEAQLQSVFRRHGITQINPMGEKFNPNHHEALFELEDTSKEAGSVGAVTKIGYKLHERVVRPAMVGVIKGS